MLILERSRFRDHRDQTNGAGTLEESVIQQVWGARYIIEAVAAAAAPSGARIARAGRRSGERSSQELAFQLTDAQFSVIAVATPGKPGVVIDRIAYSPYGEATRTLRSDVNGDGFVNQSDYSGIIRPRNGAAIGTAAYVVEADLDRNGVINQLDYDILIADDGKSSSGGVGEAGLFSRGVRNSIGYCGYIFNEDSGLYTVRFRTYSPTLGRWLERDPAGYVDGMGLYEYVRGGPITAVDPTGLDGVDIKFEHWMRARDRERKREALFPVVFGSAAWLAEAIDDPDQGCGVVVRQNTFTGIDKGHQWIEIPAVDGFQFKVPPTRSDRGIPVYGVGFYPSDSSFGSEGNWYSVGGANGWRRGGCKCYSWNDPATGTKSDSVLPVERVAPRGVLRIPLLDMLHGPRLWFGSGAGKFVGRSSSGEGATCKEIRECLLRYVSTARYDFWSDQCRTESERALAACGLRLK